MDEAVKSGKVCPYCGRDTEYVDSLVIYEVSYGMIYLCSPCNAWVGVHKGTDKALGRLANSELRGAKKRAHRWFDNLWKSKYFRSRKSAYKWLSEKLDIPEEETHIGMFDVDTCFRVVEMCREFLRKRP